MSCAMAMVLDSLFLAYLYHSISWVHEFIYPPYYLFCFGNKRVLHVSMIASWYHYVNRFLVYGFDFMILNYIHFHMCKIICLSITHYLLIKLVYDLFLYPYSFYQYIFYYFVVHNVLWFSLAFRLKICDAIDFSFLSNYKRNYCVLINFMIN
jgi:hypothetical protein